MTGDWHKCWAEHTPVLLSNAALYLFCNGILQQSAIFKLKLVSIDWKNLQNKNGVLLWSYRCSILENMKHISSKVLMLTLLGDF